MKHPFTRTKSVFLLSSLHTLDYHLPRTNCLQGGKSNTRWLCYPLANNSIWCCCICLNVPSSGISFCTNFKFFYSVLYPVGPLDWYFKLLCCKLRNMVKYILLCYCWCLTFCLCYFFTFFFSNYDRQLLSLMQILILHAHFGFFGARHILIFHMRVKLKLFQYILCISSFLQHVGPLWEF